MQLRPRHRRNRCGAADHGTSDRMFPEDRRQEDIAERVLRIVVAHRDLLEHHGALELHVLGCAHAPQHHVGDQVDRQFQVAVEHVRVVAGVLPCRERVQLTADRVHRLGDLHRAARRSGLEQQVLEEVRGARDAGTFVTRTDAHPHSDRSRAHRGDVLGDDAQTTRQGGASQCGLRRGLGAAADPSQARLAASCLSWHRQANQRATLPRPSLPRQPGRVRSCRGCRCRRSRRAACRRPSPRPRPC